MTSQRAGVDRVQPGNAIAAQLSVERALSTRVASISREFPNHKRTALDAVGLCVVIAAPVIANQRVSHYDHLAGVRRVADDFLVATHAGVENHLAVNISARIERSAEEHTVKHSTAFEHEPTTGRGGGRGVVVTGLRH